MAIELINYDDFDDYTGSSRTTWSNNTALSTTTGNFLVVIINSYSVTSNTGVVTGVADTAGNTYQKAIGVYRSGTTYKRVEIWYAENITGNASNITTATFTSGSAYPYISVAEFSGVATSSSLIDTSSGISAYSTTISSGVATSSNTGDLIVGGCYVDKFNLAVGDGFTTLSSDLTSVNHLAEYAVLGAAGDYDADASSSSSNTWGVMDCAIFANANPPPSGTNLQVQVGDVFRPVSEIHVNVGDVWRPATAFVNVGDVWRA